MRKSIIGAVLLGTALLGAGYAIGQIQGPTASSAAGSVPTATTTASENGTRPEGGPFGLFGHMGPRADGTVKSVNGNTITVQADSDQGQTGEFGNVTTIVLTGTTTYGADHDTGVTATKASIKVGSYLIAKGTLSADGKTLTASEAFVRGDGPGSGHDNGPGA